MKVLLLFPMRDGQTGPAIKYAFKQLGHKVRVVDAKLKFANSFNTTKSGFAPDLVFCSRTEALIDEVAKIKEKFPKAIICMWNVDTRGKISKWGGIFPLIDLCHHHFVVNDYHVDEWNEKFEAKTTWLSQGLQDEVYDKPESLSKADTSKYACDVSFAGTCRGARRTSYQWRKDIFAAIREAGIDFKTWGCEGNPKQFSQKHNKMVALSKINLGISRLYGGHTRKCVSVRDYKIMGAGGFLLELYRDGLYDVFPKDTIDSYIDPDDIVRKIKYWLDRPRKRRAVAERGYKWAHENATYTIRIQQALEVMGL